MRLELVRQLLSASVTAVAAVVLSGWWTGQMRLTQIHHEWPSMKLVTASCFVLAGIMASCMASTRCRQGWLPIAVSSCAQGIIFAVLITAITYSSGGAWVLGRGIDHSTVSTIAPGLPSIGTLVAFLGVGSAGIIYLFNTDRLLKRMRYVSTALAAISSVSLLGYALDIPAMYFYFKGVSSGMAVHTAILFGMLAANFHLLAWRATKLYEAEQADARIYGDG